MTFLPPQSFPHPPPPCALPFQVNPALPLSPTTSPVLTPSPCSFHPIPVALAESLLTNPFSPSALTRSFVPTQPSGSSLYSPSSHATPQHFLLPTSPAPSHSLFPNPLSPARPQRFVLLILPSPCQTGSPEPTTEATPPPHTSETDAATRLPDCGSSPPPPHICTASMKCIAPQHPALLSPREMYSGSSCVRIRASM